MATSSPLQQYPLSSVSLDTTSSSTDLSKSARNTLPHSVLPQSSLTPKILFQLAPANSSPSDTTTVNSTAPITGENFIDDHRIFVDTALFPTHKPVRTLGVMEGERWISLKKELAKMADMPTQQANLSQENQLELIKLIIVTHYASNTRGLPLWGDIQRYCYYQTMKGGQVNKIWFNTNGEVTQLK